MRSRRCTPSGRAATSQRSTSTSRWYWKLGVILQGIIARVAKGQYGKGDIAGYETVALVEQLAQAADEAERAAVDQHN